MWPIVRQLPIKTGWWDPPLTLRHLAKAIQVKINTKRDQKLWKTFFYKSRNYCHIFISTKPKMLHQKTLFSQNGKIFNDLHHLERVENTRHRNLKMYLFPRIRKNQVILFFAIYISISTKLEIFHQWRYFHKQGKN